MFRLSITIAAFAAALITSDIGHAETSAHSIREETPKHSIVLFGASWCAPCIVELRNIAALAASARPAHIVIAWTDGGIGRYTRALPGNVEIAPGPDARRMARNYLPDARGLPFSVMLDQQGRKCAQWNAQLTDEAIRRMREACRASPG